MGGIDLTSAENRIWRIVQSIIQLAQGRMNCTTEVTLRPGQETTTVSMPNFGKDALPILVPMTATAAGAIATVYVSRRWQGGFELTHNSDMAADRRFGVVAIG